jgi:hypothetical protein
MEHVSGLVLGLAAGFIGLATIAVLVSPAAQTNALAGTLFAGIAADTRAAVSPLDMGRGGAASGLAASFATIQNSLAGYGTASV